MDKKEPLESLGVSGPISDETRLSRHPGILSAAIRDETVMMNAKGDHYFGLDDIGTHVWERIATPCSFAELIDSLAAKYDASRSTIATDVARLLKRMAAEGIIKLA